MPTSEVLTDSQIEHQLDLVKYGNDRARSLLPFLLQVVEYIEVRLAKEGESIQSKKNLNILLKDVQDKMNSILTKWETKEFQPIIPAVAKQEVAFQASAVNSVVVGYESVIPAIKQVESAAFNNPLLIGSKGGAVDFSRYTKNWKPTEIQRVASRISAGFYAGETTSQIARAVNGLKSRKYADGVMNMSRANIQGMVKTTINHMASEGKAEFAKQNSDLIIGEQWVSTLDSSTSSVCRSRDGNQYLFSKYGKNYPRPPAHINACVKGSMITTDNGLVAIEDVKVGDMVLTHTGRFMSVTTVMCREHQDSAYMLVDNFGRRVRLTDEHPILTLSDGWKTVGNVSVGDVVFNNSKEFVEIDGFRSSLVENAVLLDSHNMETEATNELISYGIFSKSAGVSSAVNLKDNTSDNEVGNVDFSNHTLEVVLNSGRIKCVNDDLFVFGRVILKSGAKASSYLDFSIPVVGGIVSLHSIARLFGSSLCSLGILPCPMVDTDRLWREFLAGVNGVLSISGVDSKLDASLSDCVVRNAILSLNKSEALSILPVLNSNEFGDGFVANTHFVSPDNLWFNSTIESIVEYRINDYVYNISVAEDETYIADGFLVHNCRSTMSPILSPEYDFTKEGRKRPAVTEVDGKAKAEQVSGSTTYYQWLKTQNKAVKDKALGVTQGKVFRNAGLTAEEFKKATVNSLGQPISLAQMEQNNKKIAEYLAKQ